MAKVMITFDAPQPPSIADVKQRFGLADAEIDEVFGVIEIDPDTHSYAIRVEDTAARRIGEGSTNAQGPYSDPKIAPFGPPRR